MHRHGKENKDNKSVNFRVLYHESIINVHAKNIIKPDKKHVSIKLNMH